MTTLMTFNPITFRHWRSLDRVWRRAADAAQRPHRRRIAIQAGLVPVSLGLIGASAFVLASVADRNVYAGAITAVTAVVGFATKLNPLWVFAVAGVLGLSGWL